LIGASGEDHMWGDGAVLSGNASGGADGCFRVQLGGGSDFIYDFRQTDGDLIHVAALNVDDMSDISVFDNG